MELSQSVGTTWRSRFGLLGWRLSVGPSPLGRLAPAGFCPSRPQTPARILAAMAGTQTASGSFQKKNQIAYFRGFAFVFDRLARRGPRRWLNLKIGVCELN